MKFICNIELHIKAFDNKFFYSIPTLLKSLSINDNHYGVVNLPTTRKRFTVLRSPHIDKKSRDQFELRVYKKIYTISKTFSISEAQEFIAMSKRKLPAGLGINYICNIKKN